jgi:predicted TIM-barrel fold metal-dependent hydrolase
MPLLIDADVHISPTPQGGNSITIDELLLRMNRSGVDKAVTWLQPPYVRSEIDVGNAYVLGAMRQHPDCILGFGWADPNLGVERAIGDAQRALDQGCYGVKLNGAQNGYPIDDPHLAMPVIEAIAQAESVLALHVGADAYDHTHPARVATIARAFPELRILVVHMGGAAFHDLSAAAIAVAREYPNLTLVGSAVRAIPILTAIRTLGADRVCFGSDTPFELMHVELAKYRALLDSEISAEEMAGVMGGTIARVLRLTG